MIKLPPRELFSGLSAFPLTPTDENRIVQADTLALFLDRIHAAGAASIGLLGSTGSYAYLAREQRRRAVNTAVQCVGGKIPIIAGVGAMRTDEAEALAQDAKAAGADGLLLAPVSYLPLNEEEVFQHFAAVSRATDLPLCIYNNPSTTKFTFSATLIARLAELPNVCAVKMPLPPNGDFVGELRELRSLVPDDFSIGYSGDWGACSALLSGCDAWYSVVGGLLPSPAVALTKAAQSGNRERALDIDAAFAPLWELFKAFGSYRVMYMMANVLRVARIAPPHPILPLADELRPQLEEALGSLDQTHSTT